MRPCLDFLEMEYVFCFYVLSVTGRFSSFFSIDCFLTDDIERNAGIFGQGFGSI